MRQRAPMLVSIVAFGYALLYVPIVSVVIYSFNDSRLVTLWGGFSLRWYASLLEDDKLLEAALLSLRIAVVSATFATALGAIVALALHRVARLRGRVLLSGMVTAPLVMPEIITGLSLLFLFISMANLVGWPMNRGATTITIAHITFSMAYVVVVVRSRLANMDESLEEAAMDLGGRPLAVFFDVTVPMLLPALVSGWLLAFTLRVGPRCNDAADVHLRQGPARRDAGHQRHHHHHHRPGRRRGGHRVHRHQSPPAGCGTMNGRRRPHD
jgi:putrescine transport system permease protein